jgi:hypothetical protein
VAFPTIAAGGTNPGVFSNTANAGTWNVPLPTPTGGILADDLLLFFAGVDGNFANTVGGSFTPLGQFTGGGNAVRLVVAYKWAVGGETGTIALTTNGEAGGAQIYCIRGADPATNPAISAGASGSSTAPNPASLNPADWDVEDTLWIALAANDANVAISSGPSTPSGWTGFLNTRGANTVAAGVGSSLLESAVASVDPGTFTLASSEDWAAATVAVRPLAGGGGTDHTHDVDDAIEGTDAAVKAIGPRKADTIAGTDAQAKTVTHPAADTIQGTDAASKAIKPAVADSIAGTDASNRAIKPGIADSIAGTDNRTAAWDATRTIPDAVAGTDAISKAPAHPVADTGSLTDAHAKTARHAVADAIAGTDANAKAAAHPVADPIGGTDALERAWDALLDIADAGELDDNVNTGGASAHTQEIDDSIAGTDTIAREWDAARTIPDTIQGADATAKLPAVNRADTLAGTDSVQRAFDAIRQQADTGQLADDQTVDGEQGQHHTHTVNDGITGTDSIDREWAALLQIADVQTIIDQLGEPVPALIHLIFHEEPRRLVVTEQHHVLAVQHSHATHTERASLRHRETP